MKKLFTIMLCSVIVSAFQGVNVSAENISNTIETINYQNENLIMPMRSDDIIYKYRQYNNRLQRRRWNATQNYWVDPYWIYV